MEGYFNHEELLAFKNCENKPLTKVVHHFWINRTQPGELFEFLDKIELTFGDNSRLVFATKTDELPGICLDQDFDSEKEKFLLMNDFGGKIDMRSSVETSSGLWKDAEGKILREVQLVDDGENTYRDDAVLLDFGDHKIELRPAAEGLILEPFEDV
ncbi:MAG TPA: hypothetical protein VL651_13985 [Bacteroidia bacterium]|jgi:hypothetical protein|nr:hypothetical protein [Bacteroidia bacterium]